MFHFRANRNFFNIFITGVEITIFSNVRQFCRNFLNFIFKNISCNNLAGCQKLICTCSLGHMFRNSEAQDKVHLVKFQIKTNITLFYLPLILLNNVSFHNCYNVLGFFEHTFLRKHDTCYFNFFPLA